MWPKNTAVVIVVAGSAVERWVIPAIVFRLWALRIGARADPGTFRPLRYSDTARRKSY